MMSGAILAVPTEAAERYVPGVYKAGPERWFRLSLWGLLSQEVEASLRQPLLRELLRHPILPRLLELPLSLLLVIRRHGSRQQAAGSRQQAAGSRQQAAGNTFRTLARLAQDE